MRAVMGRKYLRFKKELRIYITKMKGLILGQKRNYGRKVKKKVSNTTVLV
jgi:hypothetical protein